VVSDKTCETAVKPCVVMVKTALSCQWRTSARGRSGSEWRRAGSERLKPISN
jgi:hypothetical protein